MCIVNILFFESSYNSINYLSQSLSPLGNTTSYTYDGERRLTGITRPSGKRIGYVYADGKLERITGDVNDTLYTYGCGQEVLSVERGAERIDFTHDGPLLLSMAYEGELDANISFEYNARFLPSSITYAGATEWLNYDKDKLLTRAGEVSMTYGLAHTRMTAKRFREFESSYLYSPYGERNEHVMEFEGSMLYTEKVLQRSTGG